MKRITLTKKDMEQVLLTPLETPTPDTPLTVTDLRSITKIAEVIESRDGSNIDLEDADFDYLKNRFDSFGAWNPRKAVRDLTIATSDALEAAQKVTKE